MAGAIPVNDFHQVPLTQLSPTQQNYVISTFSSVSERARPLSKVNHNLSAAPGVFRAVENNSFELSTG